MTNNDGNKAAFDILLAAQKHTHTHCHKSTGDELRPHQKEDTTPTAGLWRSTSLFNVAVRADAIGELRQNLMKQSLDISRIRNVLLDEAPQAATHPEDGRCGVQTVVEHPRDSPEFDVNRFSFLGKGPAIAKIRDARRVAFAPTKQTSQQ